MVLLSSKAITVILLLIEAFAKHKHLAGKLTFEITFSDLQYVSSKGSKS